MNREGTDPARSARGLAREGEIDDALVGEWRGDLTFSEGPRRGERERLRLTFLADGVILGIDERRAGAKEGAMGHAIRAENGQLPPAVGEWTAAGDRFSYWLNAVLSGPAGRPMTVVHGHGQGTLAADGQMLTVSGGSEIYGGNGELLGTNRADLVATRAERR